MPKSGSKRIYSGNKKERNNQAVKKYQQTKKGKISTKRYQNSEAAKKHREKLKTDKNRIKYNRKYFLQQTYGLTLEQYDQMLEQQGNVCAICGGINPDGRRLCVDHNHSTNQVRGLLCLRCNTYIGVLENKEFVNDAKKYLQKY